MPSKGGIMPGAGSCREWDHAGGGIAAHLFGFTHLSCSRVARSLLPRVLGGCRCPPAPANQAHNASQCLQAHKCVSQPAAAPLQLPTRVATAVRFCVFRADAWERVLCLLWPDGMRPAPMTLLESVMCSGTVPKLLAVRVLTSV